MDKITPKNILLGGIGTFLAGILLEVGAKTADYALGAALSLSIKDILSDTAIVLLVAGAIVVAIGIRELKRKTFTAPPQASLTERGNNKPPLVELDHTEDDEVTGIRSGQNRSAVKDIGGKRTKIRDVEEVGEESQRRDSDQTEKT